MKLGIEKTAMIRVRAGISHALTESMDEGHCGLPTDELVPLAVALLEVPGEFHPGDRTGHSQLRRRHRAGIQNGRCGRRPTANLHP